MQLTELLKNNDLSITESRMRILGLFKENAGALSTAEIEKQTDGAFDRVTVYRTLQTFMEKGIVHQIPTTDNSVLYALCKHDCGDGHHYDDHVHFICEKCAATICMEGVTIPDVRLPKGFKKLKSEMVVKGICKECKPMEPMV